VAFGAILRPLARVALVDIRQLDVAAIRLLHGLRGTPQLRAVLLSACVPCSTSK